MQGAPRAFRGRTGGIIAAMGLASTRVFGHTGSGVVVVGMRRRPARDLYHWLVTGSWARVVLLYALVYFATQALFGVARLLLASSLAAAAEIVPPLAGALGGPADRAPALSASALGLGALQAVHQFVQWAELVLAAGIVFTKFALVQARVLFSDVAVIGPHEGGPALMFRMANERTSHLVDAKVSVMLVRNELQGGELVRRAHDLGLARRGSALFSHAWTAVHPVDRDSPLLGESPRSLEESEAEIIVTLSGIDEALARTVHARHVYPASRVRWNARFREIVKVRDDGTRVIDYRKFHRTTPMDEAAAAERAERTPGRRAR
jgi:inward rectifier potassium channel